VDLWRFAKRRDGNLDEAIGGCDGGDQLNECNRESFSRLREKVARRSRVG
jgi:hypothetical protein